RRHRLRRRRPLCLPCGPPLSAEVIPPPPARTAGPQAPVRVARDRGSGRPLMRAAAGPAPAPSGPAIAGRAGSARGTRAPFRIRATQSVNVSTPPLPSDAWRPWLFRMSARRATVDGAPQRVEGVNMPSVRVASLQYYIRPVQQFSQYRDQVQGLVETAADYRCQIVVFPEYFTLQLLTLG